jgi:two-component system, OmpR family, response regulator ResD
MQLPLARNSLRIVQVEDDDDLALLTELGLRRAGFEHPIVRCKDGLSALQHFRSVRPETAPHVVLLDIHLPFLNGFEVLRWLRHDYTQPDVAVYILSSSVDPQHRAEAAAGRATKYLLKSCHDKELVQALDEVIARTAGIDK